MTAAASRRKLQIPKSKIQRRSKFQTAKTEDPYFGVARSMFGGSTLSDNADEAFGATFNIQRSTSNV